MVATRSRSRQIGGRLARQVVLEDPPQALVRPLVAPRRRVPPLPAPARPVPASAAAGPQRDVTLDLLRGLAMFVLVVNHTHLESALGWLTEPFLSAAETLVVVSGVVVGMVFGRRWRIHGGRATAIGLLRRSLQLYRVSVCVVAAVAVLASAPGLATEVLTIPPRGGEDLYAFDGTARLLVAILTLEAGPWQFNVLGFFVAAMALAPALLWALARGWWPAVLVTSWTAFAIGRETTAAVLPFQSEDPFPVLIWQLLFVHGVVAGRYREVLTRAVRRRRRAVVGTVLGLAAAAAYVRLHELGLSPFGVSPEEWRRWDREHFSKADLDAARLVSMLAFAAVAYLLLSRLPSPVGRLVEPALLALGRNSFYVFTVHVFVCLALAGIPALAGGGLGLVGNAVVQLAAVALVVVMVRRRVLFGVIPR